MKYRPEIDGLRALAVVPVILFHADIHLFQGGFVGVDVFFVISGYLITSILINDIEQNRFSLYRFYERRARRILPALFVVMICSLPFALLWMEPTQLAAFSRSLIAVSLFVSNILFWRENGYFEAEASEKPLLHTWSLSVEEQYYLLFPLALAFTWRFGRNFVFWLIAAVAVCSFMLSEWGWRTFDAAAFYLAPTRAWEIFAGSLAAFVVHKHGVRKNDGLALLGFAAIIFSVIAYDNTVPFPSVYTLVPVLGAVLVVMYAQSETLVARLLSFRGCVGLGLLSYSAYLWHQPLFAFAKIRMWGEPGPLVLLGLSLVTFGLAWMSWAFVEQPFRSNTPLLPHRRSVFAASLLGIALFCGIGLSGHINNGFDHRLTYDSGRTGWQDNNSCTRPFDHSVERMPDFFERCVISQDGRQAILIGDSHAGSLAGALRIAMAETGIHLTAMTNNACLPFPETEQINTDDACRAFKDTAWELVKDTDVPIILAVRWRIYFEGRPFDNGEGGIESGEFNPVSVVTGTDATLHKHILALLERFSETRDIILVSQIPEAGWDVPNQMWKATLNGDDINQISTSYEVYLRENQRVNQWLDAADTLDNVHVVRAEDLVCTAESGRCANVIKDTSLYRDEDHTSFFFSRMIAQELLNELGSGPLTSK